MNHRKLAEEAAIQINQRHANSDWSITKNPNDVVADAIESAIDKAVAAERARCAGVAEHRLTICEEYSTEGSSNNQKLWKIRQMEAAVIAKAIYIKKG